MLKQRIKHGLARVSRHLRVPTLLDVANRRIRGTYLRGVNYHETEPQHIDSFRRHLEYFLERYQILDEPGLDDFFAGRLSNDKPALLIQFDDGQANNHEVAAEILEEHGLRGWFFIIASFPGTTKTWGPDLVRHYMDWDRVADLSRRGHAVGCHSFTHRRLAGLDVAALRHEVVEARLELERHVERPVRSFCIPFGTADSFDASTLHLLAENYDYVFNANAAFHGRRASPYNLGRVPLEPYMDLETVEFLSAGAIDLRFLPRWARTEYLLRRRAP